MMIVFCGRPIELLKKKRVKKLHFNRIGHNKCSRFRPMKLYSTKNENEPKTTAFFSLLMTLVNTTEILCHWKLWVKTFIKKEKSKIFVTKKTVLILIKFSVVLRLLTMRIRVNSMLF